MTRATVTLCSGLVILSSPMACSDGSDSEPFISVTYSVQRACELLAPALCEKRASCGAVIDGSEDELACLECPPEVLTTLVSNCVEELRRDPNASDVDGCVSGIPVNTCERVCTANFAPPECAAFTGILFDEEDSPNRCATECISG